MLNENATLSEDKNKIKLDYSLEDPQARIELVEKIIASTPSEKLLPRYLEILANYILDAQVRKDKREKKKSMVLTDNRMVTINKRETSYEGLVEKFENGEDAIYNLMTHDKNIIFSPKVSITQQDLQEIPELKKLHDSIKELEPKIKKATGKNRFLLMKALIEMRKDQYVIKNSFKPPIRFINIRKSFHQLQLTEKIQINKNGSLIVSDFSLLDPSIVSLLLCNYSKIKENTWNKLNDDAYYIMLDLDNLIDKTLKEKYPLYFDLLIYKIDKLTNEEIQILLFRDYNIKHSIEYISSLWRKKIPKLLAEQAQKDYLIWYYTEQEKGQWKRCSRCGQIKLTHNLFFSRNSTSKDGFYSICKECRNKKKK